MTGPLGGGLRIEGTRQLGELAAAMQQAGDRTLRLRAGRALRSVAKPIGARVVEVGSRKMPARGGFAERVRTRARVGVTSSLNGTNPRVTIRLSGLNMRELDAGVLRHPVFNNKSVWRAQPVPAHAFTDAFEDQADVVRAAGVKELNDLTAQIAGQVNETRG